jgi:sulfonate transport system permease protein
MLNIPGIVTFVCCAALWELAIRSGLVVFEYLPAPSTIAGGLLELARSGQLMDDTLHTLRAVALGWGIALALGITLGLLLGFSKLARTWLLASIEVLRPMPGIALVPVALLLFGFSIETELVVIVLPALWPILINTMGGTMGVPARLYDVGQTLRLPRADIVRKILFPAALPAILVGARIGLGLALVLAIVAEMVGNPQGLGYGIVREQQAMRPDLMFAYTVTVGVLGIALNAAMVGIASLFPAAQSQGGTA